MLPLNCYQLQYSVIYALEYQHLAEILWITLYSNSISSCLITRPTIVNIINIGNIPTCYFPFWIFCIITFMRLCKCIGLLYTCLSLLSFKYVSGIVLNAAFPFTYPISIVTTIFFFSQKCLRVYRDQYCL